MNLDRFLQQRQSAWTELSELTGRARGRPDRLPPSDLLRLGALYRGAAADLAMARRRFPGDPVVLRLEDLVRHSRSVIYDAGERRGTFRSFFARDYWVRVRERPMLLAVAALLLFGSALLAAAWAMADPPVAAGFVSGSYAPITERQGGGLGLSIEQQAVFSSQIFSNNIRVTFLAFATGITAGLGTAAVLLFNGAMLGVIGGLSAGNGQLGPFVELVFAHGLLELSCIVVTAAAGLRMGWALVVPGPGTRGAALVEQARPAVEMVLGTAPWLVVAGLIEGFITPRGIGVAGAVAVGLAFAAVYWTLVMVLGRPTAAPGLSPEDMPQHTPQRATTAKPR